MKRLISDMVGGIALFVMSPAGWIAALVFVVILTSNISGNYR